MGDDEKETNNLETKILRRVYVWLLAGGVGIGSVAGIGGFRPDPFTGTDGEHLKAELMREVRLEMREHKLVADREHYELATNKPPPPTRSRINYVEYYLERKFEDFEPPTQEW